MISRTVQYTLILLFVGLSTCVFAQVDDDFWEKDTDKASPYELPGNIELYSPELVDAYNTTVEVLQEHFKRTKINVDLTEDRLIRQTDPSDQKTLKKNLKVQKKELDKITDVVYDLQSAYSDRAKPQQLEKQIKKAKNSFPDLFPAETTPETVVSTKTEKHNEPKVAKYKYPNIQDRDFKYPKECKIVFDGIDPKNNKQKKVVKSEKFFYYTHPNLRSQYGAESFLIGYSSMVKMGKDLFILVNIKIRSKDAANNYGYIPFESMMRVTLIDGNKIYLKSATESSGTYDVEEGVTNYYIFYPIKKSYRKLLERHEIDEIGLMWSSGFEKYEIFNLDLVQKQLECLQKS